MPPSPPLPVRRTAAEREERRIRIMGMVRAGHSYEAIAREQQLSRERIRQIVVMSLKNEKDGTRVDHMRLQMARLEPALRLAARNIENGKLGAIPQLLRVLDRLDKYDGIADAPAVYDEDAREKLLAKLDRAAARLKIGEPNPAAGGPAEAVAEGTFEDENLENAESGLEAL